MNAINIVNRFLDAWNQHDINAIAATLSDDVIYIDSLLDEEINAAQMLAKAQQAFQQWPELFVELIGQPAVVSNMIAVQFSVRERPEGQVIFSCAEFLYIDNNQIRSIQAYFKQNLDDIILTTQQDEHSEQYSVPLNPGEKYYTSGLSESKAKAYLTELLDIMDQEELYLVPGLKLPHLANRLSISTNHLSQIINNQLEINFYEFVNRYRIRKAQQLLDSPTTANNKILNIAMETGFNSKSSFNSAFKKITGKTPREYREVTLSNSQK